MGLISDVEGAVLPWPVRLISGAVGGVRSAVSWAFSSATHILAVTSLTLAGVSWWEYTRAEKAEGDLAKFTTSVKNASKQATADQAAVLHEPAAKSAAIAENSNAQAPAYYRSVAAAADAHRVYTAPCPGGTGSAVVPGADRPAEQHDGPVAPAEMVSRPKSEDDLIVAAAGRAAQMHADAQALIDSGAAVASQPAATPSVTPTE